MRLVTLNSKGRGDFANRKWHFLSSGSLDYTVVEPPTRIEHQPYRDSAEEKILEVVRDEPLTSRQILGFIPYLASGTLRNAITSLRRKGQLVIHSDQRRGRRYGRPKSLCVLGNE